VADLLGPAAHGLDTATPHAILNAHDAWDPFCTHSGGTPARFVVVMRASTPADEARQGFDILTGDSPQRDLPGEGDQARVSVPAMNSDGKAVQGVIVGTGGQLTTVSLGVEQSVAAFGDHTADLLRLLHALPAP